MTEDSQPLIPPQLTHLEKRLLRDIRRLQIEMGGKPFAIVVRDPGGKQPIQVFHARPAGLVDKE